MTDPIIDPAGHRRDRIVAAVRAGKSQSQVARDLGLHVQTVHSAIRRARAEGQDLPPPRRGNAITQPQACTVCGALSIAKGLCWAHYVRARRGQPNTTPVLRHDFSRISKVADMALDGVLPRDIADRLCVSRGYVHGTLFKLRSRGADLPKVPRGRPVAAHA